MTETFSGFPREAFAFWRDLETHNNREWFQAHQEMYEQTCREPLKLLMNALPPRYGRTSKISRINRDMRFVRDRSPYKTYIAAGIGGHYIALSKEGLYVGAGLYKPQPAALARFRAAVADAHSGPALATLVRSLKGKGYDVDTHDRVASAPRGYAADHPRIDLLRMKDIHAGKRFAPAPWLSTAKALDRITRAMDDTQPLIDWIRRHVGTRGRQ
jgi:uncharacterized protein (TIGR02453 family)